MTTFLYNLFLSIDYYEIDLGKLMTSSHVTGAYLQRKYDIF